MIDRILTQIENIYMLVKIMTNDSDKIHGFERPKCIFYACHTAHVHWPKISFDIVYLTPSTFPCLKPIIVNNMGMFNVQSNSHALPLSRLSMLI